MDIHLLRVAQALYVEASGAGMYRSVRVDCEPSKANVTLRLIANDERRKAQKLIESADQLDAMAFELERKNKKTIEPV